MTTEVQTGTIETRVPARMDRLPWSRWHWRVVLGLGTVWTLDGLEVTMVGSVASRLTDPDSDLGLTPGQIGLAAAIYIVGACTGALVFGQLTDRFGRKKLFLITLLIYIAATVATAFAFSPWYFYVARFVTGAGIGGEYAAIHSAIDELIPARVRGRVDLVISGTYWLGAACGAGLAILFLNEAIFPANIGWRVAFGVGAVLGLVILFVRRHVPESPRWLFIHGQEDEAERIVDGIERQVAEETGEELPEPGKSLTVRQRRRIPFRTIAHTAFKLYPQRAVLGLALFVGQAFLYNGITFNLGTLLSTFFGVASAFTPVFFVMFAVGNFLGPLTLGRLFDSVGRKIMITTTYIGSAALTVPLAWWFVTGAFNEWTFILMVIAVFFLASAGASAAYLTVSEVFPMETRALAIAFFYAVGTAVGGISGPLLFGQLIGTNDAGLVATAFLIGAAVMTIGGVAEIFFGVRAEKTDLETIAAPLTAQEAESGTRDSEGAGSGIEQDEGLGAGRRREAERYREEVALARGRAADHRAAVHELRSRTDLPTQDGERGAKESLADVAELHAQELEERATAQDELGTADDAEAHEAEAASLRAEAADERADAHAEHAAALAAESDGDVEVHLTRSRAAIDRSRAAEQRALAEHALVDVDDGARTDGAASAEGNEDRDEDRTAGETSARARSAMHTAWAEVHDERARAETDAAQGRSGPDGHGARIAALEERALAAEQHLHAAEHRATAEDRRQHGKVFEQAGERQAGRTERERRARELEERLLRRAARRSERERQGLRRFRPGPGPSLGPTLGGLNFSGTDSESEQALDREIETVARAVAEQGPTQRQELARLVGARYWGPGRFGSALDAAVDEGRIRRVSRRTYAPPKHGGDERGRDD
jgi:MFS family permease